MNQEAIDQIKAERDELRRRADWYEELRTATDGGSESMTHEDAIEHVLALAEENERLREAAQLAIDALDTCKETMTGTRFRYRDYDERRVASAKAALKEAAK